MRNVVVLSVAFFYSYAECHYAECRYVECRGAKYKAWLKVILPIVCCHFTLKCFNNVDLRVGIPESS